VISLKFNSKPFPRVIVISQNDHKMTPSRVLKIIPVKAITRNDKDHIRILIDFYNKEGLQIVSIPYDIDFDIFHIHNNILDKITQVLGQQTQVTVPIASLSYGERKIKNLYYIYGDDINNPDIRETICQFDEEGNIIEKC